MSDEKKEKPLIELRDVFKTYYRGEVAVPAVRGISLEVYPEEFIAIMGPSGSGKSTLMNLVGCLDYPTKGTVFLYGDDISTLNESELAQIRGKRIGFVFQQFNLIPSLTALKNVALPMVFQNVNQRIRESKARELLGLVGLSHRINHRPYEMSGGEMQRVAIARALINDPGIIFADEPTGNLDSKSGRSIMELIRELNKKHHKTIVMVTHEQYIANYAKKLVRVKDGKIVGVFANKRKEEYVKGLS